MQYYCIFNSGHLENGRHFDFFGWLTGFIKRAIPKEYVCQFWCLSPEVNDYSCYFPHYNPTCVSLVGKNHQLEHIKLTMMMSWIYFSVANIDEISLVTYYSKDNVEHRAKEIIRLWDLMRVVAPSVNFQTYGRGLDVSFP